MTQAIDTAVPRTPSPFLRARAALAAEWIKLRSLRSIPVTLPVNVVLCIGFADLVSSNNVTNYKTLDAARRAAFDPLFVSVNFVQIGVIFFGLLGALMVTNEYGTGLIRTTFTATPQRGLVLAAKTGLLGLVALLASSVIIFTAFFTGQAILRSGHVPSVGLGAPGVVGHLFGAIGYLTAAGLMGVFIGVLSRGTAVASTSVFGLFLVLPVLVDKLPHSAAWKHAGPYLPSNAGASLWGRHVQDFLGTTGGTLTLAAYLVVLGAAAALSLRGRDA
jgi:ABC-2 type transport system permease protein